MKKPVERGIDRTRMVFFIAEDFSATTTISEKEKRGVRRERRAR